MCISWWWWCNTKRLQQLPVIPKCWISLKKCIGIWLACCSFADISRYNQWPSTKVPESGDERSRNHKGNFKLLECRIEIVKRQHNKASKGKKMNQYSKEDTWSRSWNAIAGNICNNSGAERKNRSRSSGLRGVQVWPAEINSPPHLSDSLCCKNNRLRGKTRPSLGGHVPQVHASLAGGEKAWGGDRKLTLTMQRRGHINTVEERPLRGRGRQSDWWPLSSLSITAHFLLHLHSRSCWLIRLLADTRLHCRPPLLVTWYFISLLDHLCNWNGLAVLLIFAPSESSILNSI